MNDQVSNWNLFWKFLLHILLYIIFSVSLFFLLFVSVISYPSQCWFWVLHYTKLSKTSELHIHTQILVPLLLFSIAIYVSSFVFFFLPNDNITIYCICISLFVSHNFAGISSVIQRQIIMNWESQFSIWDMDLTKKIFIYSSHVLLFLSFFCLVKVFQKKVPTLRV